MPLLVIVAVGLAAVYLVLGFLLGWFDAVGLCEWAGVEGDSVAKVTCGVFYALLWPILVAGKFLLGR